MPVWPIRLPSVDVEGIAESSAPVASEHGEDAEGRSDEAGPERPHVDEARAGDHEAADADEGERQREREPLPTALASAAVHVLADDAAVPAEQEDGREEEPSAGQAEPDELGMGGRVLSRAASLLSSTRARACGAQTS